ncbi:MAG: DinB family protein [bacterium]
MRGTPARVEERVEGLLKEQLTKIVSETWSIQENIGHLADLEPLWLGRLDDLLSGASELREADLTNAATHNANHNSKPIAEIIGTFRELRQTFVARLDKLSEVEVLLAALHPRLKRPMRTIDLVYFVAEHDDHHLAQMTKLLL